MLVIPNCLSRGSSASPSSPWKICTQTAKDIPSQDPKAAAAANQSPIWTSQLSVANPIRGIPIQTDIKCNILSRPVSSLSLEFFLFVTPCRLATDGPTERLPQTLVRWHSFRVGLALLSGVGMYCYGMQLSLQSWMGAQESTLPVYENGVFFFGAWAGDGIELDGSEGWVGHACLVDRYVSRGDDS